MKYDFNTTPDQLLASIVKKDPIPDIQNYLLWFEELNTYLQHDSPISVYCVPHNAELKMRKARARFNVRIRHPETVAEFNLCMPVGATVPDVIEYLYAQVDAKGAANIKSDKDRTKLVRTYGLYLASDQNEHGLVLTPDRTIESYRLKPEDTLLFKKRPKDTAEMLITSHAKTAAAAQVSTFVRIVCQAENAQAMFKFPSTVTVQQAISKASRKFAKYGAYGLQLPKGKNVKKTIWLEPQRLLSSYGLENMCTLEFLTRSGAVITTPNDDIGDADTTVALPQDDSPSLPPPAHFSGGGGGPGYDRVPVSSSTASTMRVNPGLMTGTFGGTISSPAPQLGRDSYESMANSAYPPSNKYPPATAADPYSNSYGQPPGSMPPPPAFQTQPVNFAYGQPPGGLPPPGRRPGPAGGGTFGGAGGTTMSLPPPIAPAAAAPPPSDIDVLDDLLGDIPGIDTSQILDNAEPKPARQAPSTIRPGAMPAPIALPPPIRPGGGGGGGAPPPSRVSAMPPPPAFGTMSLPPPPAVSNSFRAPEWEKDDEELHALDSAPTAATGGDDEWAAIDECLDFDLEF
jgi:hypothetical protein